MTDFRVDDRVRVLPTSATANHAGRVGAVVLLDREGIGSDTLCLVLLDYDPVDEVSGMGIPFFIDELEPEASDTP